MKNWKKILGISLLGLAFGLGSFSPAHSEVKVESIRAETSERYTKGDYSKFLAEYEKQSSCIDSLTSEDFTKPYADGPDVVVRAIKGNPDFLDFKYLIDSAFMTGMHWLVAKDLHLLDNTLVYHNKGVVSNFYSFYTPEGVPVQVSITVSKQRKYGSYKFDNWEDMDFVYLTKGLDSNYYSSGMLITDEDSLESIKKIFDLASKNHKKIRSLIQEKIESWVQEGE